MRTYAERKGHLPAAVVSLFRHLCADFETLPDVDPAELVSCHVVCRVLARRYPDVRCVDGHFGGRGSEHSWLILPEGKLADMYPIGGCVPFLVDLEPRGLNPWSRIYVEDSDLLVGRMTKVDETVDLLLSLMPTARKTAP